MAQITGKGLKVGDVVRHAQSSPRVDGKDRACGTMYGTVTGVLQHRPSGGAQPCGKVRVLWASGSEAVHDAVMIVKETK